MSGGTSGAAGSDTSCLTAAAGDDIDIELDIDGSAHRGRRPRSVAAAPVPSGV